MQLVRPVTMRELPLTSSAGVSFDTPREKIVGYPATSRFSFLLKLHGQQFWFSELIYRPHHNEGCPIVRMPITRFTLSSFPLSLGQGFCASGLPQMLIRLHHQNPS